MAGTDITPFVLDVPDDQLDDLRDRLRRARLPEPETVSDWSQGIPHDYVAELAHHWLESYDWRRVEAELNRRDQFRTEIGGLGIHFLHVRSERPGARPLLITHGWPGSVVEVLDVIDGLVAPPEGEPAFHLVVPSLPGFGFSDKPTEPGWSVERIADAWAELMTRLGYERFLAQGGDWGAMITTALGLQHPYRIEALHTTMPLAPKPDGASEADLSETEKGWRAWAEEFRRIGTGYSGQQRTRPQTLGYGLVDSPVGQLAWIVEKFYFWTDCDGHPENAVSRDRLLDNVTVYWLGASGASSARIYWESHQNVDVTSPVRAPSGISVFPYEMGKTPRAWVEARYDVRYYNVLERGGHFAMLEVPETFVAELRAAFGT